MPENGRCPVVHFDHNSQEHSADPVASYRALREKSPIAYTEAWGGYYVLAGYKPLFEAARDDDRFSSARLDQYPFTQPPGWGYPLPIVYLAWLAIVAMLYPACRWYAAVKQRRSDWWLSYL